MLKKIIRKKLEAIYDAMEEKKIATPIVKDPKLKKVFICSPFRPMGDTKEEREKNWQRNMDLAQNACRYAVVNGCVPYAPHLYFPQFLSDDSQCEREIGIFFGLTWLANCDEIWIVGMRISEGMNKEIAKAKEWGIPMKAYTPFPDRENRVVDVQIVTEDEFYEALGID